MRSGIHDRKLIRLIKIPGFCEVRWWTPPGGVQRGAFQLQTALNNVSVAGSLSVDRKSSMAALGLEDQAGRRVAHIVLRVLPW